MDLAYDLDEALIREGVSKDDLQMLRDAQIPGVPSDITDKQLLLFLNAYNKDQEKSREVIEAYYKARKNGPEFFSVRDAQSDEIKQCFEAQLIQEILLYITFHDNGLSF